MTAKTFTTVFLSGEPKSLPKDTGEHSIPVFVGRGDKPLGRARYSFDTKEWFNNHFEIVDPDWYLIETPPVALGAEAFIEERIKDKFLPIYDKAELIQWLNDFASQTNVREENYVIMHQGKVFRGLLFDSVLKARNYIKMQYPKRVFKEPVENTFTDTNYGATFKIEYLKSL